MSALRVEKLVDDVIEFWFGALDEEGRADSAHQLLWFKKSAELDAMIRQRFSWLYVHLHETRPLPAGWSAHARNRLAAIIVLDQFSRNMFRDTPSMFSADPAARSLSFEMIALGEDHNLPYSLRPFVYMPLMHSESLAHQELCVSLFERFASEHTGDRKLSIEYNLKFAVQHRNIIAQFGRFPHRNDTLGRTSTEAELRFLSQPGSSF